MKSRRYTPQKRSGIFSLNITSMTDMFTILLVFLLQTYSTAEVQLKPEEGLRLPQSTTQLNPVLGVKVSLSKNSLKLEERVIAELTESKFSANDLESSDNNFIKPLFKELKIIYEAQNDISRNLQVHERKENKKFTQILLQADSNLPYELIRKVFYTASMAGFPQMKIVTIAGH